MLTTYKSCEILANATFKHFETAEFDHAQYTERYNELTEKFKKLQEKGLLTEEEVKKLTDLFKKDEAEKIAKEREEMANAFPPADEAPAAE